MLAPLVRTVAYIHQLFWLHGGLTENAGLELNWPKSQEWKVKDQRTRSISHSTQTTHVLFTSWNINKFQHEKPFICPNAENSWIYLLSTCSFETIMSTSATLEVQKTPTQNLLLILRSQLFSYPLVKAWFWPVPVRFGSVPNRSDFDASGSVNRKRVYSSVCDKSEPSSWAGSVRFNMADVYMRK